MAVVDATGTSGLLVCRLGEITDHFGNRWGPTISQKKSCRSFIECWFNNKRPARAVYRLKYFAPNVFKCGVSSCSSRSHVDYNSSVRNRWKGDYNARKCSTSSLTIVNCCSWFVDRCRMCVLWRCYCSPLPLQVPCNRRSLRNKSARGSIPQDPTPATPVRLLQPCNCPNQRRDGLPISRKKGGYSIASESNDKKTIFFDKKNMRKQIKSPFFPPVTHNIILQFLCVCDRKKC